MCFLWEISKVKRLLLNISFRYLECNCDPNGSRGLNCDRSGNCTCKRGYAGQKCSRCVDGYFQSSGLCNGKIQLHL